MMRMSEELELFDDEEYEEGIQHSKEIIMDERQIAELLAEPASNPNIVLEFEDYDEESFQKGVDDHSYISGAITAILNTGVSEQFALEYLLNKDTIKYNLEATEINKKLSIDVAKIKRETVERHDL